MLAAVPKAVGMCRKKALSERYVKYSSGRKKAISYSFYSNYDIKGLKGVKIVSL